MLAIAVLAGTAIACAAWRERAGWLHTLRAAASLWNPRVVPRLPVAHFDIAGLAASLWVARAMSNVRIASPTPGRTALRIGDDATYPPSLREGEGRWVVERLRAVGANIVDIWPDAVQVSVPYKASSSALRELVVRSAGLAQYLLRYVRYAMPERDVRLAEIRLSAGDCPVCGTPVSLAEWLCPRCSTPHHGDCLRWVGRCCVYGCAPAR